MLCIDLKFLSYITNGVLIFLSIILIVLGAHCSKIPGPFIISCSHSIVLGVFICLITIIGLVALRLEQLGLCIIYLILLMCILGAQAVFAIKTLLMDEHLTVKSFLKNAYIVRTKDTPDEHIRHFQEYFKCCGYSGPYDEDVIIKSQVYISKGDEKPSLQNATYLIEECCPPQILVCTRLDSYQDNCVNKIVQKHRTWRRRIATTLIISTIIIVLVTVLSVKIFAVLF